MENPKHFQLASPPVPAIPQAAVARIQALLARGQRVILGIAAPPGAGKSTLAQALQQHFDTSSQYLPMDGFHLANSALERLGRLAHKGAPDTFDSAGYAHLLGRLRNQTPNETIYAPDFDRSRECSLAGVIPLYAGKPLVITEGNYLLLDQGPWAAVRGLLDEAWYLDLDPAVRHARLLERHLRYGRSLQAAQDWIAHTDEPNAQRIALTRQHADWVLAGS